MLKRTKILATLAVMLAMSVSASADVLLATDDNPGILVQGSQDFENYMLTWGVDGYIEYAGYSPGTFEDSWGEDNDPSDGAHNVFAYQIFMEGPADGYTTKLTVGKDADSPVFNPGWLTGTGDESPFEAGLEAQESVVWNFTPSIFVPGEKSDVLLFTSPAPPEMRSASWKGNVLADDQQLPGAPEPCTVALLGLGGIALLRKRRN
jgi:hypothetical protein